MYIYGFVHSQNYHEQFTSIYPHCDSPRWTSERRPARGAPQMEEMIPSNAILHWFGFRKQQIFGIFRCAILEEMAGKWLETKPPMLGAGRCYQHLQIYHQNDPDAGKYSIWTFPIFPLPSAVQSAKICARSWLFWTMSPHMGRKAADCVLKNKFYQVPSMNNVETNMKLIIPGMGMNKLLIK